MYKMFQYRMYPTKKQVQSLNETLDECRWLYNHLLENRKMAYEQRGESLSCYGQIATFPLLKQERSSLTKVHSQILQNVAMRVDLAFKAFFRRGKAGEIPGFPRFRGHEEKALAAVRRKHRKVVARVHERIGFRRDNFTHQQSRSMVNRFGVICVEDLQVNRMVHNHNLAKSISDAAWSQFFERVASKAAEAGRHFIKVNPAYTSQTCSQCGYRQKMPLRERVYHCPCCLLSIDRDLNAAVNIKAVGLHLVGLPLEALLLSHGE